MIDLSHCPACGGCASSLPDALISDHTITGSRFRSRIVRCGCGHHFLNPQPTWVEVEPFYNAHYFSTANTGKHHGGDVPPVVNGRYNHVPVVPGQRYLDIGCGTGELVAAMGRLGVAAEGVEPSREAVDHARGLGLDVRLGMLHEAHYPDASFDVLSMFHVLEHVPQPTEVLTECRRILKPGGVLVIGVPNYQSLVYTIVKRHWVGLQLPTHFQHFTATSLRQVAERSGLDVAEITTEATPDEVEYELVNWLRRRAYIPKRLTTATRVARPFATRLARRAMDCGRGESIVAHLRRPD